MEKESFNNAIGIVLALLALIPLSMLCLYAAWREVELYRKIVGGTKVTLAFPSIFCWLNHFGTRNVEQPQKGICA